MFFISLGDKKCVQFLLEHDPQNILFGKTILKVKASQTKKDSQKLIAQLELNLFSFFPIHTPLIWLPNGQKYVSQGDIPPNLGPNILGAGLIKLSKKGRFTKPSGESVELVVIFEQGSSVFHIIGSSSKGELINIL